MKRKKWSEVEEQTLITKYADLQNSGTLAKLRTREKKFKPIADHVNSLHHLQDPANFPFKWSWRDVSIKVQNMRHQYLGVKQKIRVYDGGFNWEDGENHWENFLRYKEVFGDVELDVKGNCKNHGDFSSNVEDLFGGNHGDGGDGDNDDDLGLGLGFEMIDCEDFEEAEEEEEEEEEGGICGGGGGGGGERMENEGSSSIRGKKLKRRKIGLLGARVLELRDVLVKREEKRKERDFATEEISMSKEESRRKMENLMETKARIEEERLENRHLELLEWEMRLERREFKRQSRLERELEEERRWRMKIEEKREEEEMEWRERMLSMQLDHEKQMMQMHADACQNQMQVLGIMARFMCQFFGVGSESSDGLGGGIGGLHPQVLQNLQHHGAADLGDDNKTGSDSPPEFI
ncbi:hypothetical protein RND81_10G118700 [Saponaria officinalis]|uniref:Uncharacterized protein n=1 Tax=Saponaria officinalis TaxID=3572 RepID=A0AAW1I2B0_SAPOF